MTYIPPRDDRERRQAEHEERRERRELAREKGDGLFAFATEMTASHALVVSHDRTFVPPPISENDPSRLAAIQDEIASEGRVHGDVRPQRHE